MKPFQFLLFLRIDAFGSEQDNNFLKKNSNKTSLKTQE